MGMFDQPELFSENFQEDEPFTLEDAKIGPTVNTAYGPTPTVLLKINGKLYSIIGEGLVEQVERMESSDLPTVVVVSRVETRSGNSVKKLVPATV